MFAEIYSELRRIASRYFARRSANDTLQPTEIVHEAFLRLNGTSSVLSDKKHFAAVAALAMRQVLTDRARRRLADKRGGKRIAVTVGDIAGETASVIDVIVVDDLLTRLEALEPRHARIVELRIFTGLTVEEISEVLSLSTRTIEKDWRFAKAWLTREIAARGGP